VKTYYHFTCSHAAALIGRHGILMPPVLPHPLYPGFPKVIWLTDMTYVADKDREGLGLTSTHLSCDRTKFRYTVSGTEADKVIPWMGSRQREELRDETRKILESFDKPAHWFISDVPLRAHRL
jgi:hypothetical protein